MPNKNEIIVILGDDGAIITNFVSGVLQKRLFVNNPYSVDFSTLCQQFPKAVISILLDNIDQNYIFSNLPSSIGAANIKKMVNRKIESEFNSSDINLSLNLGKDLSSIRKDLKYVFISVRNTGPLADWLEVITELPNTFGGIYLYPLESDNFISKLRKVEKNKTPPSDNWEILISHNRVGGFRQVVLKGKKIIFTRISSSSHTSSADAVGVNISQECLNTLEYIRRIGYTNQKLNFYIICSKEAKSFIDLPGIDLQDIEIFTPFDVAQKLNYKESSQESDKYGDVIFARNFYSSKRSIRLDTPKTKELQKKESLLKFLKYFLAAAFVILPLYAAYLFYQTFPLQEELDNTKVQIEQSKAQLATIKNFEQEYGQNPNIVNKIVEVNKSLSGKDYFIKKILKQYRDVDTSSSYISSVKYIDENGAFTLNLDVVFVQKTSEIGELFPIITSYVETIKKGLEGYQVEFSNLPVDNDLKVNLDSKDTNSKEEAKKKETKISVKITGQVTYETQ